MDPPSITVTTDSAIESTIDGQGGADILNDFLVQGTPAPRRISQYDNSLRRGATHGDSDTDSSDLDGTSLAQLQRQANLAKEGNEQSDSGDSDDDEKDLADMVLAASKKTGGSTIVKKMPSAASAESLASGSSSKASKPTGEEKAVKRRPAGELAKQLKFLGKQFNTIESDEVKHVLEKEKAKRDVYSFEWEANEQKPEWKQALLLSTMRPADGLKYLAGLGLMKNTPEARAKWLSHYRRMVLDNPIVIEWLCHEPNLPILECMVEQENAMAGLDIDVAFRRFVMKMDYLPDGEGLERLLNVFSGEYVARNPHRKEVVSIASAAYICNSMLALNNMYHMNRKLRRLRINDWISQSAGKNAGNDYPVGMLEEIFSNILSLPLTFDDPNSSSGYKGERRHGWVSHKLFEAKGWKKFWAVLSDKGELFVRLIVFLFRVCANLLPFSASSRGRQVRDAYRNS